MKYIFIVTALLISVHTFAQKKVLLESKEDVEKMAAVEFASSMSGPEGPLYLFGQENNIVGTYDFKVTLGDRGRVVSIFVVNREGGTIHMQNIVKDAIKATKFNFKLPKNKDYSIEYKFKF